MNIMIRMFETICISKEPRDSINMNLSFGDSYCWVLGIINLIAVFDIVKGADRSGRWINRVQDWIILSYQAGPVSANKGSTKYDELKKKCNQYHFTSYLLHSSTYQKHYTIPPRMHLKDHWLDYIKCQHYGYITQHSLHCTIQNVTLH